MKKTAFGLLSAAAAWALIGLSPAFAQQNADVVSDEPLPTQPAAAAPLVDAADHAEAEHDHAHHDHDHHDHGHHGQHAHGHQQPAHQQHAHGHHQQQPAQQQGDCPHCSHGQASQQNHCNPHSCQHHGHGYFQRPTYGGPVACGSVACYNGSCRGGAACPLARGGLNTARGVFHNWMAARPYGGYGGAAAYGYGGAAAYGYGYRNFNGYPTRLGYWLSQIRNGYPMIDPYASGDWQASRIAATTPWHGNYYNPQWGQPLAMVVPPTANAQTRWSWGVAQTTVNPLYHQFERPYPGPAMGGVQAGAISAPAIGGQNAPLPIGGAPAAQPVQPTVPLRSAMSPTPHWPSHTDQFGVYSIRGPW